MSFDEKAKDWDNDPKKVERAEILAKKIAEFAKGKNLKKAFEFGCGTGLLSFFLKDNFTEITLADTSKGMLKIVKEKMEVGGIKHFKSLLLSEENHFESETYDIIYSLMTLHHVRDLEEVLERFNTMLKAHGFLCIADLDKEEGDFHTATDSLHVHHGFEKEWLTQELNTNGFKVIHYEIFHTIKKEMENGTFKLFPLFFMIAQKE
ncbi:MAG: class I SAM-dependent methyltransferase [Salinivirgaceae bacterium]